MTTCDMERFESDTILAAHAVERCLDLVRRSTPLHPRFVLALSGGRIARTFLDALSHAAHRSQGVLSHVHFVWGDERCVPPTDAESNFRLAEELLFKPLNIPTSQIHRIRGELAPETAAARASDELTGLVPLSEEGQPVIDLVLLGMGEDGHVASLFPGETLEVMASPAVYRSVVAAKPPPRRVTLGYAAIAAAREVWVLASGTGKGTALQESLRAGESTPLARVLKSRSRTRLFIDAGTIPVG